MKLNQVKLPPNSTPEEKRQLLEKLEEKFDEKKIKKILSIFTGIAVIFSLIYLFTGTAYGFSFFGESVSFKFDELSSLKENSEGALLIGIKLCSFSYVPFIIALFAEAASLYLIFKFSLKEKINLASRVINIICYIFSLLIFAGCTYCASGTVSNYIVPNISPIIISFIIMLLNLLPLSVLSYYKKGKQQITLIKATLA